MLQRDFYMKREDGVDLYRTYSDIDMMIEQTDTGALYEEAIDVADSRHMYRETDIPIEKPEEEEDYE